MVRLPTKIENGRRWSLKLLHFGAALLPLGIPRTLEWASSQTRHDAWGVFASMQDMLWSPTVTVPQLANGLIVVVGNPTI